MDNRHIFDTTGNELGWETCEGQFYSVNRERIGYRKGNTYHKTDGTPIAEQRHDGFYCPDGQPLYWTSDADFYAAVNEPAQQLGLELPT
jgi:hypothetical protein